MSSDEALHPTIFRVELHGAVQAVVRVEWKENTLIYNNYYLPTPKDDTIEAALVLAAQELENQAAALSLSGADFIEQYPEEIERILNSIPPYPLTQIQPSENTWREFWATMDAIGAWKWELYYEQEYVVVMDGTWWAIHIEYAGKVLKTGGHCSYPPDRNQGRMSEEFTRFIEAVARLVEGYPFLTYYLEPGM